jgi:hypothetical protein
LGQTIRLLTNHYRLSEIPNITIFQYAVELVIDGFPVDRKIPFKLARAIISSKEVGDCLGSAKTTFVYDGSSRSERLI